MTAPDQDRSIMFVRREFPDFAESISARSQGSVNSGTWAFEFDDDSELHFGESQGLINYRWPYFNNELATETVKSNHNKVVEKSNGKRAVSMVVAGSMVICVFVWENRFFIVREIDLNRRDPEINAKKSYKITFRDYEGRDGMISLISTQGSNIPPQPAEPSGLDFKAGDIGFNERADTLKAELLSFQNDYAIFEAQVFIDGTRQVGSKYPDKSELRYELHADIPKRGQAVIVEVSSRLSKRFNAPARLDSLPASSSVLGYLGMSGESPNANAAVWFQLAE